LVTPISLIRNTFDAPSPPGMFTEKVIRVVFMAGEGEAKGVEYD
jgi:hypothetical protein